MDLHGRIYYSDGFRHCQALLCDLSNTGGIHSTHGGILNGLWVERKKALSEATLNGGKRIEDEVVTDAAQREESEDTMPQQDTDWLPRLQVMKETVRLWQNVLPPSNMGETAVRIVVQNLSDPHCHDTVSLLPVSVSCRRVRPRCHVAVT